MTDAGFVTLLLWGFLAVLGVVGIVFAIRLWDFITQGSEYFARENERFRQQ